MNRFMKRSIALAATVLLSTHASAEQVLNGAGASFPAPVYQLWTHSYSEATDGVRVNYQSMGSGAGVNQLKAKTVDFAGSDKPLDAKELEKYGFEQFPMLQGEVVLITSLPGIKDQQLKLDRATVAGIFLGDIRYWNDSSIVDQNPTLKLPKMRITVVRRADSSGTTFIYTSHLSKISETWKKTVGAGSSVKWPVGVGGQKNAGVCNTVRKIRGAIGYTEYAYAKQGNFTTIKTPDEVLGTTYILVRKDCPADRRKDLQQYFDWCFEQGQPAALKLGYKPVAKPGAQEPEVKAPKVKAPVKAETKTCGACAAPVKDGGQ